MADVYVLKNGNGDIVEIFWAQQSDIDVIIMDDADPDVVAFINKSNENLNPEN